MTDLNRTNDWRRLAATQFYTITDLPGEITVTVTKSWFSLPFQIWAPPCGGLALFLFGALMLENWGPAGAVIGLIGLIITLRTGWAFLASAFHLYHNRAVKVVFQPEGIHFYSNTGRNLGWMQRDNMQQIALTQCRAGRVSGYYHEFMSSGGWAQALPTCCSQGEALQRNNLLMEAFAQPLHLDGNNQLAYGVETSAPQVSDLVP